TVIDYENLLHQVISFIAKYNPTIDPSRVLLPLSPPDRTFPREISSSQPGQVQMNPSASQSYSRRNPLMRPGSILSWDNLNQWRHFAEENLSYLKKEYWISLFLILLFITSMLSIRLRSFSVPTSIDILAFLFGVVSLSARNRLYMFVIVVVISLNLFVQLIVTVFRHFSVTVLLSMICELCLVVLIAQWLFRFRRYSKEELLFYQAMTYSIQRSLNDIVFLVQHPLTP
ncbi:hypothetical protein WA538_001041, partial [Blastocystis sp. DL]